MLLISPTEPAALREIGKVSTIPEKWGCDFLFPSGGCWYGIQRKEIKDLVASMQDGRLAKEIHQMLRCERGMLIVEGKVQFTLDGVLMGKDYGQTITKAAYQGILWSVQSKGISICTTDSLSDTQSTIETYVRYIAK